MFFVSSSPESEYKKDKKQDTYIQKTKVPKEQNKINNNNNNNNSLFASYKNPH